MTDPYARFCGAWHNPDADGIGDANCVRPPGHGWNVPHSGLGGNPVWFDDDPTANLNARWYPDTEPHISEEKREGLFLTQQEWDDLCVIAGYYLRGVRTTERTRDAWYRQRALAERIIEANQ